MLTPSPRGLTIAAAVYPATNDATLPLAIYAAILATLGAAWQIFTWAVARKNRVTVQATWALAPDPAGGSAPLECVGVEVINRNDHRIRVQSVGFDLPMPDGSPGYLVKTAKLHIDELPGEIPGHDAKAGYFLKEDLERRGVDLHRPLVARAMLGTGDIIRSRPRPMFKD